MTNYEDPSEKARRLRMKSLGRRYSPKPIKKRPAARSEDGELDPADVIKELNSHLVEGGKFVDRLLRWYGSQGDEGESEFLRLKNYMIREDVPLNTIRHYTAVFLESQRDSRRAKIKNSRQLTQRLD
jgi:hypothetical protein